MNNRRLIVSLISDQTQPNVLLIKEYANENTDHCFISTKTMNSRSIPQRIQNACKLSTVKYTYEVDENSQPDVIAKLTADKKAFEQYDRIIVNLTGGTKAMSLAVFSFFEKMPNAKLLYKPTQNYFIDFRTNEKIEIHTQLTIEEYLTAYGITTQRETPSGISAEQTDTVYQNFIKLNLKDFTNEFLFMREKRSAKKTITSEGFRSVESFINAINYQPKSPNKLDKSEIVYLTGGWFEEWVKQHIEKELNLSYNYISGGIKINSDNPRSKWKNDIASIIGQEPDKEKVPNEMDVVIMKDNTLYTIECKSSLISTENNADGQKNKNILNETIFKSDSLQQLFGLRPQTIIMTLTDIKAEIEKDTNQKGRFENSLNRANVSNIKVVDLQQIRNNENQLFNLIK
ncbi:MAG: DUF1887 family protein [Paludibacteraceae bacterium]|nr:DUF1887 family protein [Paludibacteraceae bacterium]